MTKPITPGAYPTVYTCTLCNGKVGKGDVISGRARAIDDTYCVCEACLPTWESDQHEPLRALIGRPKRREKIVTQVHTGWKQRRPRHDLPDPPVSAATPDEKENLTLFIHAAVDDPRMRSQILVIVRLDPFNRLSLLNTLIDEMTVKQAPKELLMALGSLKDDLIATRTREFLEGQES